MLIRFVILEKSPHRQYAVFARTGALKYALLSTVADAGELPVVAVCRRCRAMGIEADHLQWEVVNGDGNSLLLVAEMTPTTLRKLSNSSPQFVALNSSVWLPDVWLHPKDYEQDFLSYMAAAKLALDQRATRARVTKSKT